MGKAKEETTLPEITQTPVECKLISVDKQNGVIVYETGAEEGTGFTLLVEDKSFDANAANGQLWFYTGFPLEETPNIRLK